MTDSKIFKSGYAAIVGRPNVGKSSLLNCLLKKKISITTPKPQTTRLQVLGIKTTDKSQIIYIDTPGIHSDAKRAMNRYMNRVAGSVLDDADVIVFVVDSTMWRQEDEMVLEKLKRCDKPIILAINKVDLLKGKEALLPVIDKLKDKIDFIEIIPMSALKDENVAALEEEITKLLPEGPMLFPEDQVTDKNINFQIAEIVREKLILETEEELPYATTVEIEQLEDDEKLIKIGAIIWVERQGQKAIIIGKRGERLKSIGTKARKDLEKHLNKKVFIRLWVKVKERWTDDDKALKGLGYE